MIIIIWTSILLFVLNYFCYVTDWIKVKVGVKKQYLFVICKRAFVTGNL